ncbi:MAG: hypothetical protein IT379_38630 [Deltaproteobacteria bacterium]|nr:hypothetical protein [Deltaproteobacteria bacterium]
MKSTERADLLNALAWHDEDPIDLRVSRGTRGEVTHLSARFLSVNVAPALPASPTEARARRFVAPGSLGHDLLALGDEDELVLARVVDGRAKRRFVFEQRWRGVPVHDANVAFDLDESGRLTRLDASLVPRATPPQGRQIGRGVAVRIAIDDLRARGDSLWSGVVPTLDQIDEVVVDLRRWRNEDRDRRAWRIRLVPRRGRGAGAREVLVDQLDGTVIASIERSHLLGGEDVVRRAVGTIGGAVSEGPELWRGDLACPSADAPPTGATPLARDLDEMQASLCEAERFFGERGAEFAHPNFRDWIDPGRDGIEVAIGAVPMLSIGVNSPSAGDATIFLAEGAGRAESLGHELGHTVLRVGPTTFSSRDEFEGEAVLEHMCDQFGTMLERRFALRVEDDCLLSDDVDTQNAIAAVDNPNRPCTSSDDPQPWRSLCAPPTENGGWCEGASRFVDTAYGRYDAYDDPTDSGAEDGNYVPGHTNLGIGNRILSVLARDEGSASEPMSGLVVRPLGRETFERLLFGASVGLSFRTDWARYAMTWSEASADLFSRLSVSEEEQTVRTAHSAAGIWTLPRQLLARPSLPPPGIGLRLPQANVLTRPAIASVLDAGGLERTFIFYRPADGADRIEYMWRSEVAGGAFAATAGTFAGPCVVPGAHTAGSPAAVGRDDALFVVWSEPTATPDVGMLRGAQLPSPPAGSSGCPADEAWVAISPPVDRLMLGSPAVTSWAPGSIRVTCNVLRESGFRPYPFRTVGSMSLRIGDCVLVDERLVQPLPEALPPIGQDAVDTLIPVFDDPAARRLPATYDDIGPPRAFGAVVEHRFGLDRLIRDRPDVAGPLGNLPGDLGVLFGGAFGDDVAVSTLDVTTSFRFDGATVTPLGGDPIELEWRFDQQYVVVAFRDVNGDLRVARLDDPRATVGELDVPGIPLVAESPNATDPAITVVRIPDAVGSERVERQYLLVAFGTADVVDGATAPTRLSYRVVTNFDPTTDLTEDSFSPRRRIDAIREINGVRRRVDYAMARTFHTPIVVGGVEQLHLFTVTLRPPFEELRVPDPGEMREQPASADRVRYAELGVLPSGELTWRGERPVLLLDTSVTVGPLPAGVSPEAGAASLSRRNHLRFVYPNGTGITIRSNRR